MRQNTIYRTATTAAPLARTPLTTRATRVALPLALLGASTLAGAQGLDQAAFTDAGQQVLTMLGFAVGAGILVLAAVVAAVAGFKLFKKFVGGAA